MIDCLADWGPDEFVCFMYYDDFATAWHNLRKSYYNVAGYPDCRINGYIDEGGGDTSGSTYNRIQPVIAAEMARPSLLNMSLDLTIDGDTGTVDGHIEALADCPMSRVHVVIYEDPGPRQPHVSRYFAVYDEEFTANLAGQTQDVSGTFPIDASWVGDDLHAIMFVQYAGHGTALVAGPGPGPDNLNVVHGYNLDGGWFADVQITAYTPGRYGTNVATGDLDGDTFDEILTGPGPGAVFGPQIRGFEYDESSMEGVNFLAYGTNKFGANVTAGDLDGDGYDEIITGPGPGAVFGPHVRGWNYDGGTLEEIPGISYFAYGTPKWGANVCTGDLDGDGYDEIVTGAGPGAVYGPHVRGWNYDDDSISKMSLVSFLAYGTSKFGVNVACGDIDGDGYDEIITGPGPGVVFGPHVRGWNTDGGEISTISAISFFAFEYSEYGCNVACGDIDNDGIDEFLVGAGPGPSYDAWVKTYNYDGGEVTLIDNFTAFNRPNIDVTHGVKLAVGQF